MVSPRTPSGGLSNSASTWWSTGCGPSPWLGALASAPAAEPGTSRTVLTLDVHSMGSGGPPITRTYRVAVDRAAAAAVAGVRTGSLLRLRAVCRQVLCSDEERVLRQLRDATYGARGIRRLPGKGRAA
jgi:hypothetical protein